MLRERRAEGVETAADGMGMQARMTWVFLAM